MADGVGDQRAELAELVGGVDELISLLVQYRERIRDVRQGAIEHGLLLGDLAGEVVETLGGGDDVAGLVVEVRREPVQLVYQAAQIVLATPQCGAECLSDVADLADTAAVEHHRQGGQCLLGRGIASTVRQWDQRSLIQPALWSGVCRWHQLDVLGAQQARLSEFGDGVGRQIDAAVQTHRDQGMRRA